MNFRFSILLAVLGWFLIPVGVSADEYRVSAFVQPESGITDNDAIRLVLRIEGREQPRVSAPSLPELTNLRVIGGPNHSSNLSWVNGRSTASVSLIYTLLADGPGAAEIPPIEVSVGSEIYRTEAIRFQVTKAPAGPPSGDSERPEARRGRSEPADVFLKASLGSEEVWVGQPVPLSVTLFAGERVRGFDWRQVPSFGNFWVENERVEPEVEAYRTRVGGRSYLAYPLTRKLLIPQSAGVHTIGPFIGETRISRSADDFFDFFSSARSEPVIRKTEPLKLHVRPLPEQDRPEGFSGAVGRFGMKVDLDRTEAAIDDAVALRVTLEGSGFLKSVKAPGLDAPPDLKVFPPKPKETMSVRRGEIISRKSWEWILVPLAAGQIRLPEIRFSYFDPMEGRYQVAEGEPLMLVVKRGEGAREGIVARSGIRLERRDITFIKPRRGQLSEGRSRIHQRPAFLALAVLPWVLVPVGIVAGRWRARLQQDRGLARARRARARARKRLASARRRVEQLDNGRFHEQVSRAVVDYVADRFNVSSAGLSYDRIDEMLASRGVDVELRRSVRSCLESCDFARFVPSAGRTERRTEVLELAGHLLERVDRAL